MDVDNINVSLSRLALAKAIKTPDNGESEPWIKSIIFHQSHIPSSMRNSLMYPQGNQKNQKGKHTKGRKSTQMLGPGQGPMNGAYPPRDHTNAPGPGGPPYHANVPHGRRRSAGSSQLLNQRASQVPGPEMFERQQPARPPSQPMSRPNSHDNTQSMSSDPMRASMTSQERPEQQMRHRSASPGPNKAIATHQNMASDQEDGEDDNVSESSFEGFASVPAVPKKNPAQAPKELDQGAQANIVFKVQDSESDLDGENDADSDDEKPPVQSAEDTHLQDRRMSTLRQLERGSSMVKRSRSTGDLGAEIQAQTAGPNPYLENGMSSPESGKMGAIERWCQGVSELADEPVPDVLAPHSDESMPQSSVGMGNPVSSTQPHGQRRNRRSTIGELDAQVQFQLQQQQQIAQIQQYRQSAIPQPMYMANAGNSAARMSSANVGGNIPPMDHSRRKPRKSTTADAPSERFLGPTTHSRNMHSNQPHHRMQMMRASKSDHNLTSQGNPRSRSPGPDKALRPSSRLQPDHQGKHSSGHKRITQTDARRRSEMLKNENVPVPSASTPLKSNRQSVLPYPGNMYGQFPQGNYGMMPMAVVPGTPGPMAPGMVMGNQMMMPPTMMNAGVNNGRPMSSMMGRRGSNTHW